jgi:hypothetical protein
MESRAHRRGLELRERLVRPVLVERLGEPDHLMREAISMQSVSPGWTRALRKIT